MAKRSTRGLKRLIGATVNSMDGLKTAWIHEEAFRQEILLTVVLVPAAFWLGRTTVERILLLATCFLLLVVELINTAIEAAVDRIGPENHPLSARAKDLGSAAVLLSLIALAVVWGLVAWQRWTGGP